MSKLQNEALREAIYGPANDAKEKKPNVTETIERKNDPQTTDKRFSGCVRLPHIPRPKMKVGMIDDGCLECGKEMR